MSKIESSSLKRVLSSILNLIILYNPTHLSASNQDGSVYELKPIVVTAEKRPGALLETPLSISVVTNDRLQSYGITTIKDISYLIPNLYISELSARRTSFPYFRGLGSGQGEPVVATYIDGVPQLTPNTTNIELLDIDRIEFIRGPQGALYGRNTLGGVIHVITKKPSNNKEIDGGVDFGEFSLQRYRLSLATPLMSDTAYLGITGSFSERDGYVKNNVTGNAIDNQETLFGRATLRLLPNNDWEFFLSVYGERDRDGGFVLFDLDRIRDKPYRIKHDFEGKTDRDVIAPSISVERYGTAIDFLSITGYEYWSATDLTDTDFTNMDLLRRNTDENHHQIYQEFRLNSSEEADFEPNDHISLKWLTGISFFYSDFKHDAYTESRSELRQVLQTQMSIPDLPEDFFPFSDLDVFELKDVGTSLFGQLTLTLYDRLDVQVGLGVEYEHREADLDIVANLPPGAVRTDFDEDFFELLPQFGLAYRWNDKLMVYSRTAKGFRPGGYNRNLAPNGKFQVDEEESWTYEAGLKINWFDNRLAINLALFYIDWNDMQLDVPIPENSARFFLDNVGEAESKGFEIEVRTQVNKHWELFGGFGYTGAEFDDYFDPVSQRDVGENNLPNVPKFNWNIGLQSRLDVAEKYYLFARAEVIGIGKLFFDNANSRSQNDYVLANFSAGLGGERWTIEGWIKNAFDEDYLVLALPSPFSPSGFAGETGIPQTVGISLKLEM